MHATTYLGVLINGSSRTRTRLLLVVNLLSVVAGVLSWALGWPQWMAGVSVIAVLLLSPTIVAAAQSREDTLSIVALVLAAAVCVFALGKEPQVTLLALYVGIATLIAVVLFVAFVLVLLREILNNTKSLPVCLPDDMTICTPNGSLPVGHCVPGRLVWSFDPENNQRHVRRVLKHKTHIATEVLHFTFDNCVPDFRATRHHVVLCRDGWRRCDELVAGSELVAMTSCGRVMTTRVERITVERGQVRVCQMICEHDHTLICNGIITHNFTVYRSFRAAMHRHVEHLTAALR